jgi:hypothetical protein
MGRTYEEGKKIKKSDGIKAIFTLLRYLRWTGEAPKLRPIEQQGALLALKAVQEYLAMSKFAS